jgi:trans-aconitate methyltransferase
MLTLARYNCPTGRFVQADVRSVAEPPDGVPVEAVVAHLSLLLLSRSAIESVLARIHTWLRPGGLLSVAMVDVDADAMPVLFLDRPVRISGWVSEGLAETVRRAGFEIVSRWADVFHPAGRNPERQAFVLARRS